MKQMVVFLLAVFFSLTLGGKKVNGQTIAIGHVTAEIVESVSAAAEVITNFELVKATQHISTNPTSETLNLGAIIINSGKDITCNIVLKPATLSDSQGNGFTILTAVKNDLTASATRPNGSQTIQLNGTTNRMGSPASSLYEGSYTVVFAYN